MCVHSSASRCHGDRSSHFCFVSFFFSLKSYRLSPIYSPAGNRLPKQPTLPTPGLFIRINIYMYCVDEKSSSSRQRKTKTVGRSWIGEDMCGGYILAYAETTTAAMCARRREISSSINTTHCEEAKRFVRAWRKPLPTQGDESLERIDLENLEKKKRKI